MGRDWVSAPCTHSTPSHLTPRLSTPQQPHLIDGRPLHTHPPIASHPSHRTPRLSTPTSPTWSMDSSSLGVRNTCHCTPSVQGGVVSEPAGGKGKGEGRRTEAKRRSGSAQRGEHERTT